MRFGWMVLFVYFMRYEPVFKVEILFIFQILALHVKRWLLAFGKGSKITNKQNRNLSSLAQKEFQVFKFFKFQVFI